MVGGGAKGALDACGGGGWRKIGSAKVSPTTGKIACPDALECPECQGGARWLPSIGNVFWGGGINSRVSGGHSWKYIHIRAIYVHIRHIHTYTINFMHIRTYTVSQSDCAARGSNIDAYMYIYVHIRAYTYIYDLSLYMYV